MPEEKGILSSIKEVKKIYLGWMSLYRMELLKRLSNDYIMMVDKC